MSIGIPYMGSKRKLAGDILQFITARHKGLTDFYDLFGGGGSVSFTAIRDYRFNTHYNELNSHIYSLVRYLCTHKTFEPKFYEWVSREEFFEQINRTDADWYSGFVMSCWSFGNGQDSYLYGREREEIKRLAHEFIVNGDLEAMKGIGVDIPTLNNIKDMQKRRVVFCKHIENKIQEGRMQSLEMVEHLARIKNLQNLQNLQCTNLSYQHVPITGESPVLYCDIPYQGTGEYKEGGFDHDAFYRWAAETEYPVYISEYAAPFEEVHAFRHRSSLSATNNKKQTVEKIFWNGKGKPFKSTLF